MPRGRKKKFKLNFSIKPEAARSFIALSFVLISGLSFFSLISQNYVVNRKISNIMHLLFGGASLLIPLIFMLTGFLFIQSIDFRFKNARVLLGLVFLLFFTSAFMHLFHTGDNSYLQAKAGVGGGLVGYKTVNILSGYTGIYGAWLIIVVGILASGILLFNVSIDQAVSFCVKHITKFQKLKFSFFGFNTNNIKNKKDIIQITSGSFSNNIDDAEPDLKAEEKIKKTTFEIIPPVSEPVFAVDPATYSAKKPGGVMSLAQGLPYSDRVWETPPTDLLIEPSTALPDAGDVNLKSKIIKDTLKSFGINANVVEIQAGPSVTQYSLDAEVGTKVSKISALQYDIAMALASPTGSVRIEAPIPGKSLIGIEVPNNNRVTVNFKSLITSEAMKSAKSRLSIVLGKDVGGQVRVYDISKMPHILVAGSTGSGKSVFLHSVIFSLLYRASPQEVKFILIDPKRVELIYYQDIPHLYTPVVTDMSKAPAVFRWAVLEMEKRYKLFESAKARNIDAYNEKSGFQALPYILIIVDELAEIMIQDPATVEKSIIRIAQLARATGIHLILSVQRPSTNVITGLIKANIPCRVAFNVTSQVDSRVIIDQPGAEKLLGKGDMLFVPPDVPKPSRLQGGFISDKEISNLVNYLKSMGVKPEYKSEIFETPDNIDTGGRSITAGGDSVDDLYAEAVQIITGTGKASASLLQRRLSIGYARAARIIDELEQNGIIGVANGSKPREILVNPSDAPDSFGNDSENQF